MNRLTTFETGLNKALRPRTVLILSALAVFSTAVAFLFLNFRSGGFYLGQLFFESPDGTTDTFMDFYNSVYDAAMQPYDHQVIYPPLCCVFFLLLSGIIPGQYFEGAWVPRGGFTFYEIQNAKLMLVVFFAIPFAVVVYCIFRYTSTLKDSEKLLVLMAFLASTPVLYAVERGNIIIYAVAFALLFFVCYDDERAWVREIGYIALAISAGIKIYPAFFGLLLILDKRYFAAVRTVVYGIITTILPFFAFDGLKSMHQMLTSISSFNEISLFSLSLKGGINYLISTRSNDFTYSKTLLYICMAALIISVFLTKSGWKRAAMLTLLIYGAVSNGGKYMGVFMIIPCMCFYKENTTFRIIDYVYAVMFFLFFAPLISVIGPGNSQIMAIDLVFFAVLLTIDSVFDLVKRIRVNKGRKSAEAVNG